MLTSIKNNKALIKKILVILIVSACVIHLLWDEIEKYRERQVRIELSKCDTKKLILGNIEWLSQRAKSDLYFLNYKYLVKRMKFKSLRRCHFKYDLIKFDSTILFPIIIDSINPTKNYLLVTRKDFEQFGILPPDSLEWLFKYSDY